MKKKMIRLKILKKENLENDIFSEVENIGNTLVEYLYNPHVQEQLVLANQPRNSSSVIQNVFLPKVLELGFQSEKKGLFTSIPT